MLKKGQNQVHTKEIQLVSAEIAWLFFYIQQYFETEIILMKSLSYLNQQTLVRQFKYLNSTVGLYNLFDKIQVHPPFTIPQHSLVIDLENITFGPNKYTVVLPSSSHQNFKIIYFALLYYIFQRNPQNRGITIYQNLLKFILNTDMTLQADQLSLPDEQVKTYLLKFLHMLHKQKSKHKLVGEQLQTLPQMDILFLHLIRKVTNQQDLNIQKNAFIIHQALKQQLGFHFEALNIQTFVFQFQYIVDIRFFESSCEFYIRHQTPQNVNKLKEQILLQESAHFMMEQKKTTLLIQDEIRRKKAKKFKVTKKSTIKSIQWTQQAAEQEITEEDKQSQDSQKPQEEKKIHSFLDFIPFGHKKENSTISSLSGETFPQTKSTKSIKNNCFGMKSFANSTNFGLNFSADITSRNPISNYNLNQKNKLKNCSIQKGLFGLYSNDLSNKSLLVVSESNTLVKNHFLKPSLSTKCIKPKTHSHTKTKALQQKRIPSFIINRTKAKQQTQTTQTIENPDKPKITFFYKNK